MNTGMDDASNLAWKLAALVQGWGGANLLQSYEIERRPIAERNTVAARELNKHLINMPITPEMEQDTPEGAAARGQVSAHLSTFGEEFASIGVQLGARYDGSPIVAEDGAPPADDYVRYTPSGVPGGRAPHYWPGRAAAPATRCSTGFGKGFTLLRLGGRPADTRSLEAAARRRGVPLTTIDLPACRRSRTLRPRPRADPARPVCRLARRRAAGRSRPSDRAFDRRNLSAVLPCATLESN